MESKVKKAVIYTRVATKLQTQDTNVLEIQEKQCESFARLRGFVVMSSFSDKGVSNANGDASGFEKLLDYVSKEDIDYVLVYTKDRICRAPLVYKEIEKQLRVYGVEILPIVDLEIVDTLK